MQVLPPQGKVRKSRRSIIQIMITIIVLVGLWLHYLSHQILAFSDESSGNHLNDKEFMNLRRSDWKMTHRFTSTPQDTSSFVVKKEAFFSRHSAGEIVQHASDSPQKENNKIVFANLSCGDPWSTAQLSSTGIKEQISYEKPIIWSVSGGPEYMLYLKLILEQWSSIGLSPVFMVALDLETATYLCDLGYQSVFWDVPKASYSRVADAKFEVAASFSKMGIPAFFMEVDVFCKKNPIPLFLQSTNTKDEDDGIVVAGHGYADFSPNIGQYYVWPSANTTKFFRAVAKVLEYSMEHKEYVTQNNVTKSFFDQRLFYQCLPPTFSGDIDYNASHAIYLMDDKLRQNNLLSLCREVTHSHLFPWRPVSNVYISAHHPPTLFDSTVCIHPLFESPFASLKLKVATARFLGFDPTPILPESRFLKTMNGDLTFNECWNMPFVGDDMFGHDFTTHEKFKGAISTLIYFAKVSGRTLVLPRFFRDSNAHAIMVMSLVDIRTIEDIVSVQYLPADLPHTTILADGDRRNFIKDLQEVGDHQVVAVEYFCRFFGKEYIEDIQKIMQSLKFCLKDVRIKFTKGSGSWNRLCGSDGIYDQDS